ncbi:MAG: 50S ribosomal protein L4 [Candidatus Saccharibacteria bacterium GW2011_GWA2_46_10]|nr:MAG: 50S ribosomal protein L4 [Candidatus Saccharibacteria bacterium GW2011_GWA2_46_10]
MAVATYTKSGDKVTTPAQLNQSIFGLEVKNHQLLNDAYLAYLANGRINLAVTKSRGMVRGGGAKPWRQKGTGRARFGSRRNPIWRGGGVAFGPTGHENFRRKLNLSAKRKALRQALSLAAKSDKLIVIETFVCPEGRINQTLDLLKKIGAKGSALIVVSQKDDLVDRATRNIATVKAVEAKYLTVFDVLNADSLVISKKALEIIDQWLGEQAAIKESIK